MNDRIFLLDAHRSLFLLKNAISLPLLLLSLRSAPCHHHPELHDEIDEVTRLTTEALCNIHFDDNSWSQAKLPVRYGGLGLRKAADMALTAFLSSRSASCCLYNDIPRQPTNTPEDDDKVRAWQDPNLVLLSNTHMQRNWDDILCSSVVATFVPVLNRQVCFKAALCPELCAWLNCVPNTLSALSSTTTFSVSASLSASDSLSVFHIDINVERR